MTALTMAAMAQGEKDNREDAIKKVGFMMQNNGNKVFPIPVSCICGNSISWTSAIEHFMIGSGYYSVSCCKCGQRTGVCKTSISAAQEWNEYIENSRKTIANATA